MESCFSLSFDIVYAPTEWVLATGPLYPKTDTGWFLVGRTQARMIISKAYIHIYNVFFCTRNTVEEISLEL